MEAFNSNYKGGSDSGYKPNDADNNPKIPISFRGLFKAISPNNSQTTSNVDNLTGEQVGSSRPPIAYYESAPIYRGTYTNLSPLIFNTTPVDDSNNSKLNRNKLADYDRSQLFFLLRLERFLRLRQYWLQALPREDEAWKTHLVMVGIFSALGDCQKYEVGEDGMKLLKEWSDW